MNARSCLRNPRRAPPTAAARRLAVVVIGAAWASLAMSGCWEAPADPDLGAPLEREGHETYFPIQTGVHGGISCNACHTNEATFTEFSCIDCHHHEQEQTDRDHSGVGG